MGDSSNNEIIELIKAFHRSIKKHGSKKIIRVLQDMDLGSNKSRIIEYIFDSVSERLKINKESLFEEGIRRDTTLGKKISILLLRKHLDLSPPRAAEYFKRSRQVVYNVENEFKQLNPNIKHDAEFINLFNELDLRVDKYIQELKK